MERPLGVTILAVLEIIGGLAYFGLAVFLFSLAGVAAATIPFAGAIIAIFAWVIAFVLAILMVVSFVLAYGLWTAKGWAWTLSIILAIIGILVGLASLPGGIISIVIDVLIIYYLTRPHVKAFFGKAPQPAPPPPPPP